MPTITTYLSDPRFFVYKNSGVYTHTQAGRFYLANPQFNIKAMAHSLAQNSRFTGNGAFRYSVADHSVLVSLLMEELDLGDPLEGDLHDGTESVLADIASPHKGLLADYKTLERYLDLHMRDQFGLDLEPSKGMKYADALALFIEAVQLMPEQGEDFEDPLNARPQALELRRKGWRIQEHDWRQSRDLFLERFYYLEARRVAEVKNVVKAR